MQNLKLSSDAAKTYSGMLRFGSCLRRSALACLGMAAATGASLTTPAAAQTPPYTNAALGYGYFTVNISSPTTIGESLRRRRTMTGCRHSGL
jgi:hypothetical protein